MIPNLARLMDAYPIPFEMPAITFPNACSRPNYARSLDNKPARLIICPLA